MEFSSLLRCIQYVGSTLQYMFALKSLWHFSSKDGHHASGWLYSSSIHVLTYVHVWEQKGMATTEFLNFEDGKFRGW